MTILYAACVWVTWGLGTTVDITSWDVYEGLIFDETVVALEAEVCQGTAAYTPFDVHVIGFDDEGKQTEDSDHLVVQWEWDFDVDGDGIVGFGDFAAFAAAFGKCNNGYMQVPCDL